MSLLHDILNESITQLIYFIDIRELACPFAVLNHKHARSVHADERTYARAPLSAHARPQVDPPTNVATQTATTHTDRTYKTTKTGGDTDGRDILRRTGRQTERSF